MSPGQSTGQERRIASAVRIGVALWLGACLSGLASPPDQGTTANFDFSAAYAKQEHQIPMRDGARLFTAIYAPRERGLTHPILLTRTPYSVAPYGETNYLSPSNSVLACVREGFILVFQDVRGRHRSEGRFVHVRPLRSHPEPGDTDENTDTRDTIDWLLKNVPANNGRVGLTGVSYPGFYAAQGMADSHPALKCAIPQAPVCDWFLGDDFHQNGALYLAHAFTGLPIFEPKPEPPAKPLRFEITNRYQFFLDLGPLSNIDSVYFQGRIGFWNEVMAHETYDRFWQTRALGPQLRQVRAAVLTVGGWYDDEDLYGALSVYHSVGRQNRGVCNALVIGPWKHGAWARAKSDGSTASLAAQYYRDQVEMPFLRRYLLDDTNSAPAPVTGFDTGCNQWRRFESWPPKNTRPARFFFRANGELSRSPPNAGAARAFDEYCSDPANPVPESPDSTRPDVLGFETEPLPDNLAVAGPILAHLKVSTTGTDSDWVVKVFDLPSGEAATNPPTAWLVRGGILRGKFRDSFQHPKPFKPGEPTLVEWPLPDIYHTFQRGHRVRVEVQSSWFPLFDRNPQAFLAIPQAGPADFQKATQRLYHSPRDSSWLALPTLVPERL